MQSTRPTTDKKTGNNRYGTAVIGCGHCRNLKLPDWAEHNVRECGQLAVTKCGCCKNLGHTTSYCPNAMNKKYKKIMDTPEMKASIDVAFANMTVISSAPLGNSWANLVKKSLTPQERAAAEEADRKVKEQERLKMEENKRKEQKAYLERKARRERLELDRKECTDKNFAIFQKHMYYVYGPNWIHYFDEYSDKPIHSEFYEKINALLEEDRRLEFYVEQMEARKEMMEEKEKRIRAAEFNALKKMKKLSLSPRDYKRWLEEAEDEKEWQEMEEMDTWIYNCSDDYSRGCEMDSRREEEGKIWLAEQLKIGTIKLLKDGTYSYRFYRV